MYTFLKNIKVEKGPFKPKDIAFYIFLFGILGYALYLRISLPHIAIIDGDVSGYLNSALEYFGGRDFEFSPQRGLCYTVFVLINILFGTSLYPVALSQHLLAIAGLVMIVMAFRLSSDSMITRSIALIALMVLGWDNELILLEHTIRPEGLEIFLTGTLFFLLQRFMVRGKNDRSYLALVAIATLLFLVQVKFILAGILVIAYATYIYICGPGRNANGGSYRYWC